MYFTNYYHVSFDSAVRSVDILVRNIVSGKIRPVSIRVVTLPCGRRLIVVPACNYILPYCGDYLVADAVFQSVNSAFVALTKGGSLYRLAMPRAYFYRACHTEYRGDYVRNGSHYGF